MADTKWTLNPDRPANASQGSNVIMAQTSEQPQTLHLYSTIDSLTLITLEFDNKVDPSSIDVDWGAIADKQ